MAILFSKKGHDAKWLKPIGFADETDLQKYIVDNPHSIPLSEFKEDANLVIICREFTTEHGEYIDHVGIDKDGEIYIIETKQYSNNDKRRVVAQVIDYGATLSSSDGFEIFIKNSQNWISEKYASSLDDHLQSHFEIDENELETLYQNIESNYSLNKFRFVIVMDKANDKIKKYVSFMNANSNFSIFLSEFQRYEEGDHEIIIPNLFGAENESRKASTHSRNQWSQNDFDEAFSNSNHDTKTKEAIESLINFTKNKMPKDWENTWHEYFGGTGKEPKFFGCFPEISDGDRAVFEIYSEKGDMRVYVKTMATFNPPLLKKFLQLCDANNFETIKEKFDLGKSEVHFKRDQWVPKMKDFISILEHCF